MASEEEKRSLIKRRSIVTIQWSGKIETYLCKSYLDENPAIQL